MSAYFRTVGKTPDVIDELTNSVMHGTTTSMHFFNSHVGRGSNSQDFEGDFIIISRISTSVQARNVVRCVPLNCSLFIVVPVAGQFKVALIFSILVTKNE